MIQLKIHFAMRIDDARAVDVKIAAGLYEIEDNAVYWTGRSWM